MEKLTELTLFAERGIYMSCQTHLLSEEDDLILTTDIGLYARLSQDHRTFVGLAGKLNHVDLQGLFREELFRRLVVCVEPCERNSAYFFLGSHIKQITNIDISDSGLTKQELTKAEDWIRMLLFSEHPRSRLAGIRERILILYEHLKSDASLRDKITIDLMFSRYVAAYHGDQPRRSDFNKALALTEVPVDQLYDGSPVKSLKRNIAKCSNVFGKIKHMEASS